MTSIHPSSVVEPGAQLGQDVQIGPFCYVGSHVQLGDRVRLISHVTIAGQTSMGAESTVYPFASIGHAPQDLKYSGEPSRLIIGARNRIRESVTMQPGTEGGGMETRVGDDGLFMVGSHVAHDCHVGNHVIMANNATLAGHVIVEDHVIIGGLSAIHQFVRIGAHAMIGGMSGVEQDVIPYGLVMGERARLSGLNLVGLKRHGFDMQNIHALRDAYRQLFDPSDGDCRPFAERLFTLKSSERLTDEVKELIAFVSAETTRRLCTPKTQVA